MKNKQWSIERVNFVLLTTVLGVVSWGLVYIGQHV